MRCIEEILKVSHEMRIECSIIEKNQSLDLINQCVNKFRPEKLSGHLMVGHDSISIPIEKYEFSYSKLMRREPLLIFFDQESVDKEVIVKISNGSQLCDLMEQTFGMEYFVTNESFDFLLAVNWYVIEGIGRKIDWMRSLN